MGMITVQDYVRDPVGNPAVGATVTIDLIATNNYDIGSGFVTSGGYTILDAFTITTDKNGFWSSGLQANNDITPAGTYYRVVYKRFAATKAMPPFYIIVPATDGPWWVGDITTNPLTISSGSSDRRIATATNNSISTITNTSPADLTPSALSVAASLGVDPVALQAFVPKAWINDSNTGVLCIMEGATLIAATEVNNIFAQEHWVYEEINPTPGVHTYKLQGAVIASGGVLSLSPTQSKIRLWVDKV